MSIIKAEFQANYNGWTVEVDGYDNEDLVNKLVDLSYDWCDDEGEYDYSRRELIPEHEEKVNKILRSFSPTADIEITFDNQSS